MKFNRKLLPVFMITTLLLAACGGKMTESEMNAYYDEAMVGASDDYQATEKGYESNNNSVAPNGDGAQIDLDDQMILDRKLIKNASLSFETDSLSARKSIVKKAVKDFKAYVEHEEQYASPYQETVTTTIRVPAANFDPFMDAITNGVGSFDSKTIEVDDVTEEFVDVEARINTKKELKIRFIALLDKAETIAKIMEIEREITALQAEIESYEGRLKYLSGSVKYATINLTYYRTIDVPVEFDNKFENAFTNGWQGTVWFFVGLVSIWPVLVLIAIILLIIRLKLRKQKAK
ncbi:MAG: DUF4349 domain-containing protein [Crocinitomix sp.]|nr:DUF4349 domain-containing protein [Crocinitomix sp.]